MSPHPHWLQPFEPDLAGITRRLHEALKRMSIAVDKDALRLALQRNFSREDHELLYLLVHPEIAAPEWQIIDYCDGRFEAAPTRDIAVATLLGRDDATLRVVSHPWGPLLRHAGGEIVAVLHRRVLTPTPDPARLTAVRTRLNRLTLRSYESDWIREFGWKGDRWSLEEDARDMDDALADDPDCRKWAPPRSPVVKTPNHLVKHLRLVLDEELSQRVKLSQAQELLAAMAGALNWQALIAHRNEAARPRPPIVEERPNALYLHRSIDEALASAGEVFPAGLEVSSFRGGSDAGYLRRISDRQERYVIGPADLVYASEESCAAARDWWARQIVYPGCVDWIEQRVWSVEAAGALWLADGGDTALRLAVKAGRWEMIVFRQTRHDVAVFGGQEPPLVAVFAVHVDAVRWYCDLPYVEREGALLRGPVVSVTAAEEARSVRRRGGAPGLSVRNGTDVEILAQGLELHLDESDCCGVSTAEDPHGETVGVYLDITWG